MSDERLSNAVTAYRTGRYDEAVRELESMVDIEHAPAAALAFLGGALFRTGAYGRSVSCWERLLERMWPSETTVRLRMNWARASYMAAQTEARAGRFDHAVPLMQRYCEMHKGDTRARALLASLERLAALQHEQSVLESVRRSVDGRQWSDAADQLLALRRRLDQINGSSGSMDRSRPE